MNTKNYQSTKKILGNGQVGNNFFSNNSDLERYNMQLDALKQESNDLKDRIDNLSEIALHKKNYNRFLIGISIFSFIISLLAICTSLKSFSIGNEAYVGWFIAILSTIIVVVLGWQIFNIIELKGYKESINERIENKVKNLRKDIDNLEKRTSNRFETFNSNFIECFSDRDEIIDKIETINEKLDKR